MSGFFVKGLVYSIICGIIVGFYLAQFFLNIPFEDDLAFALPSYIVAVLGATFLLKRVLERVQRANARRFAEAIVQRTRVEQLLERLIHAQEDERKRLSLELHDSPIQWLTSGVYRLEACLGFFERGDYARVNQELEQVRQVLDTTLTELRHTAAALHPSELEKVGLVKSLERYANSFEQDTGIRCQFKEDGSILRMEAATELGIYRVLQEALSNVRKHSRATSVLMEISLRRGAILASVGDNGIGFDMNDRRATGSAHLGIAGMEERARMLRGNLAVHSASRMGTQVDLTMPLTSVVELPPAVTWSPPAEAAYSEVGR